MNRNFSISIAVLASLAGHPLAADEPAFQEPFACGQEWRASTYDGHGLNAIDLVQRVPDQTIIGLHQPILASAAETVVFDHTCPSGDKEGERLLLIDHGDWCRTHYFNLEDEPNRPGLAKGLRLAMGEVIGRPRSRK